MRCTSYVYKISITLFLFITYFIITMKYLQAVNNDLFETNYMEHFSDWNNVLFALEGKEKITILKCALNDSWKELLENSNLPTKILLSRLTKKQDWKYIENDRYCDYVDIARKEKEETKNNVKNIESKISERKKLKFS